MPTARISAASSIALLLCLSGCNHYAYPPYGSPSGGYGPSMYPSAPSGGYMAPSGSYMGPSPAYVPYSTPSGPSPTPLAPNGGTAPGEIPWRAPSGNPAPSFDGPGGAIENPVPNPTNEEQEFGTPPAANLTPNTNPVANGLSSSGIELQPIESSSGLPSGAVTPSTNVVGNEDPFESPMRPTSGGANLNARSASLGTAETRPNPFAHDTRNFTWLRGIVDYDSQDQRWVMIYSADPDSADRYGGSITLSDHPLLQRIKPGDVVLVEGAVDTAAFDHHGKPLYKISKLQPLKPKT